jgi:hypothetical protein
MVGGHHDQRLRMPFTKVKRHVNRVIEIGHSSADCTIV